MLEFGKFCPKELAKLKKGHVRPGASYDFFLLIMTVIMRKNISLGTVEYDIPLLTSSDFFVDV